jgi:quercetin dioxygenase-like cupin family protein
MARPEAILGDAKDFAKEHADAFPLYIRMMLFKIGDQEPAHEHRDGHFTAVLRGRVLINVQGTPKIVEAPQLVWISAATPHHITGLPMSEEAEKMLREAYDKGFDAVKALFENPITACIHDRRAFEA